MAADGSSFPYSIRFGRLALELITPSSHRRAHRHLPSDAHTCFGAFADERRIVEPTERPSAGANRLSSPIVRAVRANMLPCPRRAVGHRRACASLVASCAAGIGELALEGMTALRTGALIASLIALRPRVSARSPMGGASLPGDGRRVRHETLVQSARAVRPRRHYTSGGRVAANGLGSRRSIRRASWRANGS